MNATHPSNLFQSSTDVLTGQRRARKAASSKVGRPIYLGTRQNDEQDLALTGAGADGGKQKVLDALVDGQGIWTAESGGMVRRVDLRSGKSTHALQCHKAPVAALAMLNYTSAEGVLVKLLLSASWDKSIQVHDISAVESNTASASRLRPIATIGDASNDFIKAIHALDHPSCVVLSGGSDRLVRIWDFLPLVHWAMKRQGAIAGDDDAAPIPKALGTFSEHTRGITAIASLPQQTPGQVGSSSADSTRLPLIYTADSLGRIFQSELHLPASAPSTSTSQSRARLAVQRELRGPETSISDLAIGWAYTGEEEEYEDGQYRPVRTAEVWVASNDKTLQCFRPLDKESSADQKASKAASSAVFGRTSKIGAALGNLPPLSPAVVIRHGDYVKSVLPIAFHLNPETIPLSCPVVISGSADEDVRTFAATEDVDADWKLVRRQRGHWHEVEKLCLWTGIVDEEGVDKSANMASSWVISTGLDGSVRRWKLEELMVPLSAEEVAEQAKEDEEMAATQQSSTYSHVFDDNADVAKQGIEGSKSKAGPTGMTAEEEAELEDLMMSDED